MLLYWNKIFIFSIFLKNSLAWCRSDYYLSICMFVFQNWLSCNEADIPDCLCNMIPLLSLITHKLINIFNKFLQIQLKDCITIKQYQNHFVISWSLKDISNKQNWLFPSDHITLTDVSFYFRFINKHTYQTSMYFNAHFSLS